MTASPGELRARESLFWPKVVMGEPSDCWPWSGTPRSTGYGIFYFACGEIGAHRAAYIFTKGEIPDGLVLDHLCRNRRCCNPAHLEAVTARDNTLRGDGETARNLQKTHCHNGHPFDEKNTHWRKEGWRMCKACARDVQVARRARLRRDAA